MIRRWKLRRLRAQLTEVEARITYRSEHTDLVPRVWLNEAAELAGKIARLEAK